MIIYMLPCLKKMKYNFFKYLLIIFNYFKLNIVFDKKKFKSKNIKIRLYIYIHIHTNILTDKFDLIVNYK